MVTTKVEVERFDGKTDFALWRQRMRAVLVQMKVVKALEGPEKLPASYSQQEKDDLMELAYSTLILHLGDKVLREVSRETTAASVWLKLEQLYMTKTLTNRVFLKGRLFGFKMTADRSVEDQLDDFVKIVIDLENVGVKIEDEDQAIMVLNSLPSSFSTFVETVKYSKDTLSMEEVLAALKQKQIEAKSLGNVADGLVVTKKSSKISNKRNGGKQNQASSQSGEKKKLKCFFCHKEGHFRKECPERKKNGNNSSSSKGEAAVAEETEYFFAEALPMTSVTPDNVWILDSGCSCHMTPHKEWLMDFQSGDYGGVHLGNDLMCKMEGSGNVKIKIADGTEVILNGVRYVPQLKRNLISLGMLESHGCMFNAGCGKLEVLKNGEVLLRGFKHNGIYILTDSKNSTAAVLNSVEESAEILDYGI